MNTSDPITFSSVRKSGIPQIVFVVISVAVILFFSINQLLAWVVQKPVSYKCEIDENMLGIQSINLCDLVPKADRENSKVIITSGLDKFASVIRPKDDPHTTYYNVLSAGQQIQYLVATPPIFRPLGRLGVLRLLGVGLLLGLSLPYLYRFAKKLWRERNRVIARKGRQREFEQRKASRIPGGEEVESASS